MDLPHSPVRKIAFGSEASSANINASIQELETNIKSVHDRMAKPPVITVKADYAVLREDRTVICDSGAAGAAEVGQITCRNNPVSNRYFTFSTAVNGVNTDYYLWFVRDGSGASDPAPGGIGIRCEVKGADTAAEIATRVKNAVNAVSGIDCRASSSAETLTLVNNDRCPVKPIAAGTTGWTASTTTRGASGNYTVTLPEAALVNGWSYTLKNIGLDIVTLATTGSGKLEGDSTYELVAPTSLTLTSDGTHYRLL